MIELFDFALLSSSFIDHQPNKLNIIIIEYIYIYSIYLNINVSAYMNEYFE